MQNLLSLKRFDMANNTRSKNRDGSVSEQDELVTNIIKSLLESSEIRLLISTAVSDAVRSTLEKINASLEEHTGKIHDLECKLDQSNRNINKLKDYADQSSTTIEELKTELNNLEQYSRRNCLRITGIPEKQNEDTNNIILRMADEKLQTPLSVQDIDRSHRIGNPNTKGHRPIIVKFTNYSARSRFIMSRRKLKSTGIGIQEDLTARNRELLKKTSGHPKISSAWSLDGRIIAIVKGSDGSEGKRRINGFSDLNSL